MRLDLNSLSKIIIFVKFRRRVCLFFPCAILNLWEFKENFMDVKEKYLRIKVIPGAAKTEIKGEMADGTIKIAVAAPPEKGKANKELIEFLSLKFGVKKENIKLISGASSRLKLIKINYA